MTPKEKANKLTDKYFDKIGVLITEEAIDCALIAVDEIIEQWEYIDTYLADGRGELNPNLKYWHEVKKWIEAF
jgi:hypothetical protein